MALHFDYSGVRGVPGAGGSARVGVRPLPSQKGAEMLHLELKRKGIAQMQNA